MTDKPINPFLFDGGNDLIRGGWLSTEITLRDQFAGMAMQAQVSSPHLKSDWEATKIADVAYAIADSMLAEREKK